MATDLQSGPPLAWPEPIVRVQHLSESGLEKLPERYVKPLSDRPNLDNIVVDDVEIPIIDLSGLYSDDVAIRKKTASMIDDACKNWGFFQVVNHGVSEDIMRRVREVWLGFFKLPLEEKEKCANDTITFEGYGSRVGLQKGQILDWRDYYKLHYLPESIRNDAKWPTLPPAFRSTVIEYFHQTMELGDKLMKIFSTNLGLKESRMREAFGGKDLALHTQANYYSKCPEPDLALGLSAHSDLGGITMLMPDYDVPGLQVRRGDKWITIKAIRGAYIINLGDQLQIFSNGIYHSGEHRVIVNSSHERFSLAVFNNPNDDTVVEPAEELVTPDRPQRYFAKTFRQHKIMVATKEPCGKGHMKLMEI
ncbi:jasmonate-induced oxygenase 1-like [Andrographis paniculata]|uniref:jasmonate-induced oxygenase 1-like n=1 Tax=Andrographis paniculata TaxID=175694 RepID=UPI0021E6FF7D|nr:jasmonate-induced oxygenase 1-like [Andrographis paniculata]